MAIVIINRSQVSNPFRTSSRLHTIFNFLSDGNRRSLGEITEAACGAGASGNALLRRRISSAVRTVRKTLEVRNLGSVAYYNGGYSQEGYKMVIR